MDLEKMGRFLAELRKKEGYTQKEIGEQLGVTDNSVSKWERGLNAPDISYLTELANIYHISVQELLKGERNFHKKEFSKDSANTILEVEKLSKKIGKRKILENINFTIHKGEIVGLIGPNGAGKSTLIKTILGLYKKNSGTVKICGFDTRKEFEKALANAGAIIETPDLYTNLTGRKNIQIAALINNVVDRAYIQKMIDFVHLEDRLDEKVKTYSLGMKQRLALLIVLMKRPNLLLLDEPTNGLDPFGIKELREILKYISTEEKIGILISSHILSEVENICDTVLIIDKGKLISNFGMEKIKYKHIRLEDELIQKTKKEGKRK